LIAAGRYDDAYMVNWHSNVFPGILGRPATAPRARLPAPVEENKARSPSRRDLPPEARRRGQQGRRQGGCPSRGEEKRQRIACIGAGPLAHRGARSGARLPGDGVRPESARGGMIWSQIPRSELPMEVIDEEVGYILDLGVEFKGGVKIDSMKKLLAENYDAVFVGSGAPRGRDLTSRKKGRRKEHPHRHRLAVLGVLRPTDKIGKRVIVLAAAIPPWTAAGRPSAWAGRT